MGLPIYLGHGASGSVASILPYVDGLRARGLDAHPLELPRRRAEDALPALLAQMPAEGPVVVGGHSYGGRVASLASSGPLARRAVGLVCLSYPLHRPGAPETWRTRVAHWPEIRCPVLLLSGESDPFARVGLLREAVNLLPNATLVTYPRLGHGLRPVIDDVLARVATWVVALGEPRAVSGR
jgi:predicted alpha/beta-hydrolase family hydrolase